MKSYAAVVLACVGLAVEANGYTPDYSFYGINPAEFNKSGPMSPATSDYDPYAYYGIDTTTDTDDSIRESLAGAIKSSAAPEPRTETYEEKKKRLRKQLFKTISDSESDGEIMRKLRSSYHDTKEKKDEDKEEEKHDDELTVDEYFAKYYPEEYAFGDANDGMFYTPESGTTSKPDDSHHHPHTPATDDAAMDTEDAAMDTEDAAMESAVEPEESDTS